MKPLLSALMAMTLVFSGCTSMLQQERPQRQFFALEVTRPGDPLPDPQFKGTLNVRNFTVSPAFNRRNLVYRMGEAAYESDYYNLFLVDPGELVTQETTEWLRDANLFSAVIMPGSGLEYAYSLEGNLIELYGDFAEGKGAAVVRIQFFLLRGQNGRSGVLLQKRYNHRVPLAERSPEALVQGYNQALAAILSELVEDMTGIGP
ncbi:MAG: ABC-type transport auxiliary lipoprotein family protein [Desulfovibrionales bacterium]